MHSLLKARSAAKVFAALFCLGACSATVAGGGPGLPASSQAMQVGAPAGARAVEALMLADGRTLVLGTMDGAQGTHAALWRLRSDGALDKSFAGTGLLVASDVPDSRGLSIQQTPDGMLHIAVQVGSNTVARLEVHRWAAGTDGPLRVTGQPVRDDWVGPAVLTRSGADWVWVDKARPQAPPMSLMPITRDAPWTSADPGARAPVADAARGEGHAILDPFVTATATQSDRPTSAPDDSGWLTTLVACFITVVGGAVWWWRRS